MADVFTKQKRSQIMAAVKSKGNKATEIKLASILRKNGIKGWRRNVPLFGNPDFVFSKLRLAVFVDGCFWHGCPKHLRKPKSNHNYWRQKIARNQQRDRIVTRRLHNMSWHVLRVWEHELKNESRLIARLWKLHPHRESI
jgi:DNA mismatch endonuclease (patch repair protein)